MINYARVDLAKEQIIMDRTFAKKAEIVGSREYDILQNCRKCYPGFEVVRRKIKKNNSQKRYRGLTYEYMKDYIIYKEPQEQVLEVLEEFHDMRVKAACQSAAFRYPVIKQWFLNRYPEIVQFGMPELDEVKKEDTAVVIVNDPIDQKELKPAA